MRSGLVVFPPSLTSERHAAITAEVSTTIPYGCAKLKTAAPHIAREHFVLIFVEPQSIVFDTSAMIAVCRPLVDEGGIATGPEHVSNRWLVLSHRVRCIVGCTSPEHNRRVNLVNESIAVTGGDIPRVLRV